MLAIDTTNPEIGVISCESNGKLTITEFTDENELTKDNEVEDISTSIEHLDSMVTVAWEVAEIIWRDNCDLPSGKFSIQSTLM